MNMYSILHAFVISATDCWVVLLLLLSLYCIDLFSCKAPSEFAINLLTYLLPTCTSGGRRRRLTWTAVWQANEESGDEGAVCSQRWTERPVNHCSQRWHSTLQWCCGSAEPGWSTRQERATYVNHRLQHLSTKHIILASCLIYARAFVEYICGCVLFRDVTVREIRGR